MESLLTTKEAAQRLGVSPKVLTRHRTELRGLPYVRLGRSIRYTIEVIDNAAAFEPFHLIEVERRRQAIASIRRRRARIGRRKAKK